MVFGEPRPIFARTFSMVGRSPSRRRLSAARSTSAGVMPRSVLKRALVEGLRRSSGRVIVNEYTDYISSSK